MLAFNVIEECLRALEKPPLETKTVRASSMTQRACASQALGIFSYVTSRLAIPYFVKC